MLQNFKNSAVAIALSVVILSGCNESTSSSHGDDYDIGNPPVETEFNEKALIANLSTIVTTAFNTFAEQTVNLEQSVVQYCQALESSAVDTELTAAQGEWRENMVAWQSIELMQLQPLLANDGKLRDDIYSWPEIYPCGVDFDTMYHEANDFNGSPYDITTRRANRKGLYALEYILFNEGAEHSCGTETPPNWNDLTETEIVQARCDYAATVAGDINRNATLLLEAWSGDTGFIHELANAGTEQSTIESEHAAVNLLSDAMFYLDSISKDAKLATPLGLVANSCGSQACPEDVESVYANHSVENLIQNLKGFNQFFTGGDDEQSTGFVDYLNFVGDEDTAATMTTAIATAIEQLEAYQISLSEALETNETQVEETHANVKAITDELKTDFIQSLALELPQTSAGDND